MTQPPDLSATHDPDITLPALRLPDAFAAALGRSVAGFGRLELALKRTIFALTRPADAGDDRAMRAWVSQMDDLADDSLGTLIEQFDALLRRLGQRQPALHQALLAHKEWRNLLCHADWQPGTRRGRFHPHFVNTRGQRFDGDLSAADLRRRDDGTAALTVQVAQLARTGGRP